MGRIAVLEMVASGCRGYKCTTKEPVFEFDRDPYDAVTSSPIIQPVIYCMNHYNERVIAALNSMRADIQEMLACDELP